MGLEKAICTYNENLIELHLNDYDKFSHWNVWYKYAKKKNKGNSCSYTTFIIRYENCSDVHDLSWIWLADKYQEDDIIWPALCFRLESLRRSSTWCFHHPGGGRGACGDLPSHGRNGPLHPETGVRCKSSHTYCGDINTYIWHFLWLGLRTL